MSSGVIGREPTECDYELAIGTQSVTLILTRYTYDDPNNNVRQTSAMTVGGASPQEVFETALTACACSGGHREIGEGLVIFDGAPEFVLATRGEHWYYGFLSGAGPDPAWMPGVIAVANDLAALHD